MKTTLILMAVAALALAGMLGADGVKRFALDCADKAHEALVAGMHRQGMLLTLNARPRVWVATPVIQPWETVRTPRVRTVLERLNDTAMTIARKMGAIAYVNFPADLQTLVDGPAFGQPLATRMKANRVNGRIRLLESIFIAPSAGAAPAIADKIIWGQLPVRARVMGHLSRLDYNAGTAACTANLGDQFVAARHLAATAINAAGSAVPNAAVFSNTSTADTTTGSLTIFNVKGIGAYTIGDLVTGTGIAAAAKVVGIDYLAKTVTLSLACTATNATQTMTSVGSAYETTDASSNLANAYASATDDCTLISTIAGAQVANNQVLSLKMAYTHD